MARIIEGTSQSTFPPLVGLREKGDFVTGIVEAKGHTAANNPFLTLKLQDLKGTTSRSIAKGKYEDVDVEEGALVQVVGSVKQLKDKLPLVNVGEEVTITFLGKTKISGGKTMNNFEVSVEE